MNQVVVQDPLFILLAPGDSSAARSNARGHLFEQFMAQVMHELGYQKPTTEQLNNKVDGVELDISMTHDLNRSSAIAECKAYQTNINTPMVTAFYGRLAMLRHEQSDLDGFFFALPRLTAEADAFVTKAKAKDTRFHVHTASTIWELLQRRGLITPLGGNDLSDPALIIHASGIYCAAIELDTNTRMAHRVRVAAQTGNVPEEVLELLGDSTYANSLPVVSDGSSTSAATTVSAAPAAPVIVEVHGSKSDFEYQLPASPKFFVGRADTVASLHEKVSKFSGPFVLNAQSGWGKSSLALKIASNVDGVAIVLDTRTAGSAAYVPAALRHAAVKAEAAGHLQLPAGATWATTEGALATIDRSTWVGDKGILIVFDQFENVFTDSALTAEFRNVALWVAEHPKHLSVGFAWKTDYVDWIEAHPYKLRDQIRDVSSVVNLRPFGSAEVDTILRRLEQSAKIKLTRELRQRLKEYSQGLPWLLKKLSGHLLGELKSNKTQEQLVGEALNVQDLFDSDLAGLSPQEREALNFVAQYAPIQASEVAERYPGALVQSLLNQRLIVQVGGKLDTYWDIFRDYLKTGRVPIEDSYILRQSPNSVARLVSELLAQGGSASTSSLAESWETTDNVVWNSVRELRQLGLASSDSGQVTLIAEVLGSEDVEGEIRSRVARALRRHKAWTAFTELAERGQGKVQVSTLSRRLQEVFPAVSGTSHTWDTYARTFVAWFRYAGLVSGTASLFEVAAEGTKGFGSLTTKTAAAVIRGAGFPTLAPGPALKILEDLSADPQFVVPKEKRKYLTQLLSLGAVSPGSDGRETFTVADGLVNDGEVSQSRLLDLLKKVPGGRGAVTSLSLDSGIRAVEVAKHFETAYQAKWTESTRDLVGRSFFGWARAAGLSTKRGSRGRRAQ